MLQLTLRGELPVPFWGEGGDRQIEISTEETTDPFSGRYNCCCMSYVHMHERVQREAPVNEEN